MILVRPQDAKHKVQLLRLLTEISDDSFLSQSLYFKGGTCASMLGFLDRFSVDLDFDLKPGANLKRVDERFKKVFRNLDLTIKEQSQKVPEFFLGYKAPPNQRNTLKLNAFGPVFKANIYKAQFLPEIDRTVFCQTIETMFGNKLVTPIDRYKKHERIAGRDFYDLHHFFLSGYRYSPKIIIERTGLKPKKYLQKLLKFVGEKVSQTQIDEDLNTLLPYETFTNIRKSLKTELLTFLGDEIARF